MKNIIPLFLIILISCTDNKTKEKELALREKELELREKELKEKENRKNETTAETNQNYQYQTPSNISTSKFVYVVFKVEQPKLHHKDSKLIGGEIMPEMNYVLPEIYIYTTEIKEILGFNEDKQYEYMDKMEINMREKLSQINMNFHSDVFMNVRDGDKQRQYKEEKAKILDRSLKTFDSYKEASIYRDKNKDKF